MMDSLYNTTRLYYDGIEIPIQGIVMDTEPTPVQHPFSDDWQDGLARIKAKSFDDSSYAQRAAVHRIDLRKTVWNYLAEEDITRAAEVAYVRNKYDKLFPKSTLVVIRAAFLTDKAQREGKVQLYEYILYKAGHDKWYVTGRSGHDTLLGLVRTLKNSAINGEFFIKEIVTESTKALPVADYRRDLPENPYKGDRDLLDW